MTKEPTRGPLTLKDRVEGGEKQERGRPVWKRPLL